MSREKAYEELFRAAYAQLYAFALGMAGDGEAARDVVSSAFEALWDRLDDVPADHWRSYLYRAVRNACVDMARRRATRERYADFYRTLYGDDSDEGDALLAEAKAHIERLATLIDTLSPQTHRVLEMCYFQGLPQADVAAQLGISVSAVKKHIGKALAHFRKNMIKNC